MALNVELEKGLLLYNTQYSFARAVPIKDAVKDDFVYQPTRLKAVG